jgi:hypothetical protein
VINTFDGDQSKLAADLATHAEKLERELTDMERLKREMLEALEMAKRPLELMRIKMGIVPEGLEEVKSAIAKATGEGAE